MPPQSELQPLHILPQFGQIVLDARRTLTLNADGGVRGGSRRGNHALCTPGRFEITVGLPWGYPRDSAGGESVYVYFYALKTALRVLKVREPTCRKELYLRTVIFHYEQTQQSVAVHMNLGRLNFFRAASRAARSCRRQTPLGEAREPGFSDRDVARIRSFHPSLSLCAPLPPNAHAGPPQNFRCVLQAREYPRGAERNTR